jgi:hypothetical protein
MPQQSYYRQSWVGILTSRGHSRAMFIPHTNFKPIIFNTSPTYLPAPILPRNSPTLLSFALPSSNMHPPTLLALLLTALTTVDAAIVLKKSRDTINRSVGCCLDVLEKSTMYYIAVLSARNHNCYITNKSNDSTGLAKF